MKEDILYKFCDVTDGILNNCALRFNAYECESRLHTHVESFEDIINYFIHKGEWTVSRFDKNFIFFILQRRIRDGYEAINGLNRRAFHSLFFYVYTCDIPTRYVTEGAINFRDRWEKLYKPRLDDCYKAVKLLHESLLYDNNATVFKEIPIHERFIRDQIKEIDYYMGGCPFLTLAD